MTARESGVLAWVRALYRVTPSRVQWNRVVLTAVGISAPIGVSLVWAPHDARAVTFGALASMGALAASAMDIGAAGITRVHRMGLVVVLASVGFLLGTTVHGHAPATIVLVMGAALVSGLASAVSRTASKAAMYFLMFVVTAANVDFTLAIPGEAALVFFLGGTWRLLLTVIAVADDREAFVPERRAVSSVYAALADRLEAPSLQPAARAAAQLASARDAARDVLVSAQTPSVRRDRRFRTLAAALAASEDVSDAVIADAPQGERAAAAAAYVREVAGWIRRPSHRAAAPVVDGEAAGGGVLGRALEGVASAISDSAAREGAATGSEAAPSLPSKMTVASRLRVASRTWRSSGELWSAVLRLLLCMAVAQGLSLALHLDRPYLLVLTVAQVMKPDLGSVFARAVQRAVGTVVGVGVASLVIMLVPAGGWQVVVIVLLAAGVPVVMSRNYGLYSVVSTPLAVLLVELHAGAHEALVVSRMSDTLIGCAIVLVLGYLPWPSTWRAPRQYSLRVSHLVEAIDDYLTAAVPAGGSVDEGGLSRGAARRAAIGELSDLRTSIAQARTEPSVGAAAEGWLPVIDALDCVIDAVSALEAESRVRATRIDPEQLAVAHTALRALAPDAQSGTDEPSAGQGIAMLPATGPLAELATALRSARTRIDGCGRGARRVRRDSGR